MKLIYSMVAAILLLCPLSITSNAEDGKFDEDLTKKISKCLTEIQKVKVGMTRADLLKVCATEGGISNRKQRRYAYKACPYIKVDVTFDPVGDEKDLGKEKPEDKIQSISQPFLEWTIRD